MSVLASSVVFLAAAVVAVPVFKKLKLGAILGYLVAGVVIGPSLMDWVNDPATILHFAELGVVLLLFVIGLELEPDKIWRMRNQILFTGGGQLILSASVVSLSVFYFLSYSPMISIVIGLAVALSSTAFAVQLMKEHRILKSSPGQQGFAVLLMQDLAVIPILLMVEGFSPVEQSNAPQWWVGVLTVGLVLLAGRYLTNPFLRVVSRYGNTEVMTAAALLIVIATGLVMQEAGLSMGMGAFIAGMLLATSSFRHQLETEIEPFKGLLLGLFFIAIGMNLDINLLVSEPLFIVGASLLLVLVKTLIIFSILRLTKQTTTDALRVGLMLSQGGEFAFVVMAQAAGNGLIDSLIANQVTLIVGISMALTAPLVIMHSIWFNSRNCPAVYDTETEQEEPQVIIAGFGRFGQISARLLLANQIPFTALDKDAEHIQFVRQFGNKIFYGDASRLDLLKAAGIEHARILLIAIDNEEEALKIAEVVALQYPQIKMIARARNRQSVNNLAKVGVKICVRELFAGSLEAGQQLLQEYGFSRSKAESMVNIFSHHDQVLLEEFVAQDMDKQQHISLIKTGREQLESLFQHDQEDITR